MEQLPPSALARVMSEMKSLAEKPLQGMTVLFNEDNLSEVVVDMEGPAATPYEGGLFRMKLLLPPDFPATAPKGNFVTKIFHPNIKPVTGDICVNALKKDWLPTHGIRHILTVVHCLLINPWPDSALNEEAAKMMCDSYDEYSARARMLTSIHAKRPQTMLANATNTIGAAGAAGAEGAGEAACGGEAEGAPPLKKLDRKKPAAKASLKRL